MSKLFHIPTDVICGCYPKNSSSLTSFKSRLVLPFWYRLAQVVLEKRLLNVCSTSSYLCLWLGPPLAACNTLLLVLWMMSSHNWLGGGSENRVSTQNDWLGAAADWHQSLMSVFALLILKQTWNAAEMNRPIELLVDYRFTWWMQTERRVAATLRSSKSASTWAVSLPKIGFYHLHPPYPFRYYSAQELILIIPFCVGWKAESTRALQ